MVDVIAKTWLLRQPLLLSVIRFLSFPNPHYFRRVHSTELKKHCNKSQLSFLLIIPWIHPPGNWWTTPSRFSSSNISSLIATKRKRREREGKSQRGYFRRVLGVGEFVARRDSLAEKRKKRKKKELIDVQQREIFLFFFNIAFSYLALRFPARNLFRFLYFIVWP